MKVGDLVMAEKWKEVTPTKVLGVIKDILPRNRLLVIELSTGEALWYNQSRLEVIA
tara:strand:- start:841 stop:1008 length:168 start_codon:yes stop_codon:yes gene_type:complete